MFKTFCSNLLYAVFALLPLKTPNGFKLKIVKGKLSIPLKYLLSPFLPPKRCCVYSCKVPIFWEQWGAAGYSWKDCVLSRTACTQSYSVWHTPVSDHLLIQESSVWDTGVLQHTAQEVPKLQRLAWGKYHNTLWIHSCHFVNSITWVLSEAPSFLTQKHRLNAEYHSLVIFFAVCSVLCCCRWQWAEGSKDGAGCLLVPTCVLTH